MESELITQTEKPQLEILQEKYEKDYFIYKGIIFLKNKTNRHIFSNMKNCHKEKLISKLYDEIMLGSKTVLFTFGFNTYRIGINQDREFYLCKEHKYKAILEM